MAKKAARKSRPGVNGSGTTPARVIEPKSHRLPNPLLADQVIHTDLKPLFDALVMVSVYSSVVAETYAKMMSAKEARGMPAWKEWPGSEAIEQARAQHALESEAIRAEYAQHGEEVFVAPYSEPEWTELISEWCDDYRTWCSYVAQAKELAKSPAVAAIMDAGEARPAHRWTARTTIDLNNLACTLHPIRMGGADGMGYSMRSSPTALDFPACVKAVAKRSAELRAVLVGHAPPPLPPTGFQAIHEYDAAILAFLNRSPGLRRDVSDVLPDKGPQDRKAVGKRASGVGKPTPTARRVGDLPNDSGLSPPSLSPKPQRTPRKTRVSVTVTPGTCLRTPRTAGGNCEPKPPRTRPAAG